MILAPFLLALQCFTTTPNSAGPGALLSYSGPNWPTTATWCVTQAPPLSRGALLYARNNAQPGYPFHGGSLCITQPYQVVVADVGPNGVALGTLQPFTGPNEWYYIQYIYRDLDTILTTNTQKVN